MATSIYDMDRTITRGGTWVPWLRFWVRREAPWRIVMLPALAIGGMFYRLGMIDRGALKAWAHRLMMGKRVAHARVKAAAADYATIVVANQCFAGALAQIAVDRAEGRRLVLATASNAYYAQEIGFLLGFDVVIATPSLWHGDWLDWRLGGPNCYGEDKAARVAEWLAVHHRPGEPLRFHSDHHSDAPVFELVAAAGGEAVATNATPVLRRLAAQRGWRLVEWGQPEVSAFERA